MTPQQIIDALQQTSNPIGKQLVREIVAAVNGDQGRVAQLRRMLLDAVDAGLRHAASVDEYKVHFEALGAE